MDRRSAIQRVAGAIGTLALWEAGAGAPNSAGSRVFRIASSQLSLDLSERGEMLGVVLYPNGSRKVAEKISGGTALGGCTARHVTWKNLDRGGFEFSRLFVHDQAGHSCRLTERFKPTNTGSIRWEIEILGDGSPWSTAIETHFAWPATAATKFWTTWGDSRPENSSGWNDPLIPASFAERALHYGAEGVWKSQALSVPLATILDANNTAVSLALSPEDPLVEMDLRTTPQGALVFSRTNHQIRKDRPLRFATDLIAHPADWRSALAWMVDRYPQFFNPPNPLAYQISGQAAYSEYEGDDLDAYKFLAMGFRINWKASYDWYTMGMFLPPVGDDVEYVCPRLTTGTAEFPTSIARLRRYSDRMRARGFYVLNYFNTFEFGHSINNTPPPPPRRAKDDRDLWRDPNDLAFYVLQDALWRDESGKIPNDGGEQKSVVMDPGVPVYQRLLLDQIRRHLKAFPANSGFCIDRMDFLRWYNTHRNDGLTWKEGRPAASLLNSWLDLMDKLGPIVHRAGKVVYGNPLYRRVDAMRHLDGFYDEFAYQPYSLNANAFLALRKPYVAWTQTIDDPDPDACFQRHLHLGIHMTVPYPMNNHTIIPYGSRIDRYFVDYGPLFDALRGRQWVLEPHVIEVKADRAKSNLFAVPGGYLAVVTFGGENASVKVLLRGLRKLPGQVKFAIEVIHPGDLDWMPWSVEQQGDTLLLDVPLRRGCALVKLSYAWIKPARTYFLNAQTVSLGTTLRDAQLRYTLDGSAPTRDSALYSDPLVVNRTTTLRLAVFRGGAQVGPELAEELVKTQLPAPWIEPFLGTFADEASVSLTLPHPIEGTKIRYTVDGGDVTERSPVYEGPIPLRETTTLRARTFVPGIEPGATVTHQFTRAAPVPPLPQVYLDDLAPARVYMQDRSKLGKNLSVAGTPLSIAGKRYERGLGLTSLCELVYKLEPEYGTFVAVAGIDDAVRNRFTGRSVFRIYARNAREELLIHQSPVLRHGEAWPIRVRIPLASHELRLTVSGGMDGERVDWVNAGFLLDEDNQGRALLRAVRG